MEKVTLDTLANELKEAVEQGIPMTPAVWLDRVARINILLQDLDEEAVLAELEVHKNMANLITSGMTVAAARVITKGSDIYVNWQRLKFKRERMIEIVRIAKQRVRLPDFD